MTIPILLLLAALVCFSIPSIRAMLSRSFDYTNTGLACFTLVFIISTGLI